MAEASIHLSYLRLRRLIGICGLALPLSAIIVSGDVLPSISHYFYSTANVLFVSILSSLGIFLLSYKGFEKGEELFSDNAVTTMGGLAILVVVIIPTSYRLNDFPEAWGYTAACPTFYCTATNSYLNSIHFAAASVFFLAMSYISVFNFTKGSHTKANKIYIFCGVGMLVMLLLIALLQLVLKLELSPYFILIAECIMLALFSFSWLVKGKMLSKG